MQFEKLSKKGYLGILVIVLSLIFLLTQFLGFPFLSNQDLFRQDFESTVVISGIGFVIGMYLLSGPLGALIAMIPAAIVVGGGCGGGGGPQPQPDLGPPPAPPSIAGHIIP